MKKELVIDVKKEQVQIALLEDNSLVELNKEMLTHKFVVGNVYIGRVKKIMQGMNAAFVDIGHEKEAFIHYHDLGEHFPTINNYVNQTLNDRKRTPKFKRLPDLDKNGNINSVLTTGQYIMVQIVKEPINTKGPRITGEISIAGRYVVLLPLGDKISVSQKIKSKEERLRLHRLLQSITPPNNGVIVRTATEGKRVAELDNDLKILLKRWEKTVAQLRASKGVGLLLEESGRSISILRDLFNPEFEQIYVNDKAEYEEIKDYISQIAFEQKDIVKYYNKELPIFDSFAITKQIKSLFGRTVSFKRGAYIVLDQTEAMHVIDVNSGNRTKASQSQEENAIEVNLAAAAEIARQLRLRDMGGIIVVDFIDMLEASNRQKLYDVMVQLMANDRARHNILPLSKFGLMQITRQRVRPAMTIDILEKCPTCLGTGKAQPSILFADKLEEQIEMIVNEMGTKQFTIHVNPYVEAFLKKGFPSLFTKWRWKYSRAMKLLPIQDLGFLEYEFIDAQGDKIDTSNIG